MTSNIRSINGPNCIDSSLLSSTHIPLGYRDHFFVSNSDIDCLRTKAWFSAAAIFWKGQGILNQLSSSSSPSVSHIVLIRSSSAAYFSSKSSQLKADGYCIMQSLLNTRSHILGCCCTFCTLNFPNDFNPSIFLIFSNGFTPPTATRIYVLDIGLQSLKLLMKTWIRSIYKQIEQDVLQRTRYSHS